MEKNANYIRVELIEDTLTKDCHLAISVISPSREEHTYAIPVECRGTTYYVDRKSPSFKVLMKSCSKKDILKAIENFNSLGNKIIF